MYEQVFNLTSRPFTSAPYVKHFFPARAISAALQQCRMTIDRGAGPVVVVGDHGTGKTLLLAMLEDQYQSDYRVVNLSCSMMQSRSELLQSILFEIQRDYRGLTESEMRLGLIEYVKSNEASGAGVLLLIDDAQKLSRETIEELQLLTNFIRDGQPRVRLILAGSQSLEDRLADPGLESFNQRVAGRCFLECLDRAEVEAYVRTHIQNTQGDPDAIFDGPSYRAISDVTEGRPRFINQVCDHAMIFSATRGVAPITDSLVREAWMDVQKLPCGTPTTSTATQAGAASTPIMSVDSSDGWTVLEFGELESESESEPVAESHFKADTPEQPELEQSFEPEDVAPQSFATEEVFSQESGESATEPAAEFETVDDPFLESPDSNLESDWTQEEPTPRVGADILAAALSSFTDEQMPESPGESQVEVEAESAVEFETPQETPVENHDEMPLQPPPIEVVSEEVIEPIGTADSQEAAETFADPFADDSFDDEEVLTDTYSPFVAQQNQRSLDVTAEHLRDLTPNDMVQSVATSVAETQEPEQPESDSSESFEGAFAPGAETAEDLHHAGDDLTSQLDEQEESFPTFESAMESPSPVREPTPIEYEQRMEVETRHERDGSGPESYSDEFCVDAGGQLASEDVFGSTQHSIEIQPVDASFAPIELSPEVVPLDPDAELLVHADSPVESQSSPDVADLNEAAFEPASQTPAEPQPLPNPAVESDGGMRSYLPPTAIPDPQPESITEPENEKPDQYHEQVTAPNNPEISRMAADIIKSLNQEPGGAEEVSHETPFSGIQQETAAIEDTIHQTLEQRGNPPEDPGIPAVVMPDMSGQSTMQAPAMDNPELRVPPVQPVDMESDLQNATEQESAILGEIRDSASMMNREQSIPYPTEEPEMQDDRDILNVSSNIDDVNQTSAPTEETELPAWSQAEPSRGEANRVDYQQLFNQLRNIKTDE